MKISITHIIYIATLFTVITSCNRKVQYSPAPVAPLSEVAVESLFRHGDKANSYFESSTKAYQTEIEALDMVTGYTDHGLEWLHSPAVEAFGQATDSLALTSKQVSDELGHILGIAQQNSLDIARKSYATVIWGKTRSIIFCDSVMLIALNHYLGSDYEAYDMMPSYLRQNKTPEMLPYDMAEAMVATSYPFHDVDNPAVINRIVYEGIITEAKMRLVKDARPELALGYSQEEYKMLEKQEPEIWRKLVGAKIIFDHSETVADRLLLPAPSSQIIGVDCPGRVGRFIGYKIVRSYLKQHPETSLRELLEGDLYRMSNPLTDAYYNP